MGNALQSAISEAIPAPNVLDVLAHIAERSQAEIALLHSAVGAGLSVLAFEALDSVSVPPEAAGDVLGTLESAVSKVSFDAPHPLVGWLGYISYDIGRTLETIPSGPRPEGHWPLVDFRLFRNYLIFDHTCRTFQTATLGDDAPDALPPLLSMLRDLPPRPRDPAPPVGHILEVQSPDSYRAKVARIQEYIAAGDIYQANLAQRWAIRTPQSPAQIFAQLCAESPAPYAAFLRFGPPAQPRHVISASPELFLSVQDGHAVTRPIKGTRRRDRSDAAHDAALRAELLVSPKDRAELAMIVDLLRNDLGRVAQYGSVRVTEPRVIEQHPTVWHTVATVEADLRSGAGLAEVLRAACPGGSITGAPKIRAMQIIEELEGFRRELYCGNIGVIGPQGRSLSLNIAIRTILMQGETACIYAGGGVVADSDPQLEYEETLHKAAAMMRALGI